MDPRDQIFDELTPLGLRVTCTRAEWNRISPRKPAPISGRLEEVVHALREPDEVRAGAHDLSALLFYRRVGSRWVCAVVRREGDRGRLIGAHPADKLGPGELYLKKKPPARKRRASG